MSKKQSTVEILLQIREDLKGLTAFNAGLQAARGNMAAVGATAKQQTAAIDRDFGKLSASIKEKFSAKGVGMSLLGGLGIGSAFGVINTVVSHATSAIEAHRQSLLLLDSTWKGIIETSRSYQFDQLTPAGKAADLDRQLAAAQAEYQKLTKLKDFIFTSANTSTGQMMTTTLSRPDDSVANQQRIQENLALQQRLAIERERINQQITKDDAETAEKQKANLREISVLATQTWAAMEKNYTAALADMPESDFTSRRDAIEDMFLAGQIGAEAASRALKDLDADQERWTANATEAALKHLKIWSEVFETIEDAGRTQAMENNAEEAANRAARAAEDMGWAFSSAFETAILDGKKVGDVLRGLIRDIAQIALRQAVINPIGEGIGNFVRDNLKLAGGGSFITRGPTSLTVGDNPGGIEMVNVIPLSGVGTSTHNGRAVKMAGGGSLIAGGGGRGREVTIVQNINLSTGVQGTVRAELLAMLPMFRSLAQDSVREGMARGDL